MAKYKLVSALSSSVLRVALYARVSSEQQTKEHTIASQLEALKRRIAEDGFECDAELCFVDDGYSGSSLIRPALDRLRDQAAAGAIDRLYVLSPDRLSRKICISSSDRGRTGPFRCRGRLPEQSVGQQPRRKPSPPSSGHDCRVRACQDHGAEPSWQATCCAARFGQRVFWRTLWVPLRQQARRRWRGMLSSRGQ